MSMHDIRGIKPVPLAIEERRDSRSPLHLPAFLLSPGGIREAVLVTDISTLGCKIVGAGPVKVGRYLGIHVPGMAHYAGWVAWQTREEFGLDFSNPLPAAIAAHITRLGLADQAPHSGPSSSG